MPTEHGHVTEALPRNGSEAVIICPHCHCAITCDDSPGRAVVSRLCGSSFRVENVQGQSTVAEVRKLGRFVLITRVGHGTFGEVWRARDTKLDRIVALKIPHAHLIGPGPYAERFRREGLAAARLRHPGIVRLY